MGRTIIRKGRSPSPPDDVCYPKRILRNCETRHNMEPMTTFFCEACETRRNSESLVNFAGLMVCRPCMESLHDDGYGLEMLLADRAEVEALAALAAEMTL